MTQPPTFRPARPRSALPSHSLQSQRGYIVSFLFIVVVVVGLVLLSLYIIRQDRLITSKFEGKRWNLPAKVYSQSLPLYQGASLNSRELEHWLNLLDYRLAKDYHSTGTYTKKGSEYFIHSRAFTYANNDVEPDQVLRLVLKDDQVEKLQSTQPNPKGIARLEPILIGGIYPDNNEDRIVMNIKDVPQPLIDALIATEDRGFYQHHGISVRGTVRAMYANATGKPRQGGSTITQQLIKNFYLNSERTVKRKVNEAIMALLLESHYSKQEILQTYMNEITLGQNGNHSINGFGLAAQFYFSRPLNELRLDQLAMLVGLAKGPTQYNPFRYPQAALERRNVVLDNMRLMGKIDQATYQAATQQPLDVVKTPIIGQSRFPDYLDVVKRELTQTYDAKDLKNEGLRIFTSFDPNVQRAASEAVSKSLTTLKKSNPKQLGSLQAALVSANPNTGELLAVVGSSNEFTGFNRAVDAKRQVGSLLKPIIYLTAFEQGKYNLASSVDDSPMTLKLSNGTTWSPSNYGGGSHGKVPLITALANSYNLPAVRVGLEVGVPNFLTQLHRMGIKSQLPNYPAVLLGALNLAPMDMLGVYQVLATGGFQHDIHTIRSVVDNEGRIIQGNQLKNNQVINANAAYMTNYGMQQVIESGTAKAALPLNQQVVKKPTLDKVSDKTTTETQNPATEVAATPVIQSLGLAGKTGTTNDYRDAWFAGYSGNYVSVVWVGRDDNKPTGLSGGNGALPVWINFMQALRLTPVSLKQPNGIEWHWLENGTGLLTYEQCPNAVYLPVDVDNLPQDSSACATAIYQQQQEARFASQRVENAAELYQREQQRQARIDNNRNDDTATSQPTEPTDNTTQPLNPEPRSQSWLEKSVKEMF